MSGPAETRWERAWCCCPFPEGAGCAGSGVLTTATFILRGGRALQARVPVYMPTGYISDRTPPSPLALALGNE